MLSLDPDHIASPTKDAATIIVVRDAGTAGVELFCVERSKKSHFFGGALVFPGGKLDPDDAAEDWHSLATTPRPIDRPVCAPFTTDAAHLRALAVAACRETLEEGAMLHVVGDNAIPDADLITLRQKLATHPGALRDFLRERRLRLDLAALHPLSHWITPTAEPRRYDTRFFVAVAPPGQQGAHDEHETMASFWATPAEILRRWHAGDVQLAPPTHCTLALLAGCTTTAGVLAVADASCLDPILPLLVRHGDTVALALPGAPEHEVREQRVPGPLRYVLRGERWQADDASAA